MSATLSEWNAVIETVRNLILSFVSSSPPCRQLDIQVKRTDSTVVILQPYVCAFSQKKSTMSHLSVFACFFLSGCLSGYGATQTSASNSMVTKGLIVCVVVSIYTRRQEEARTSIILQLAILSLNTRTYTAMLETCAKLYGHKTPIQQYSCIGSRVFNTKAKGKYQYHRSCIGRQTLILQWQWRASQDLGQNDNTVCSPMLSIYIILF